MLSFKELEFTLVEVPVEELASTSFTPMPIAFIADLEASMAYLLLVTLSIFCLTVTSAGSFWKIFDELGIRIISVTAIMPIMINLPIKWLSIFGSS